MSTSAQFGMVGLGVMGAALVRPLDIPEVEHAPFSSLAVDALLHGIVR